MSNFDDDDDGDFFGAGQPQGSKLSSLFKSADLAGSGTANESLKYRPPKQPTSAAAPAPTPAAASTGANSGTTAAAIMFFAQVQVFKYVGNKYEPLGKQGLALIATGNAYKLLVYVNKAAPTVQIRVGDDFRLSLQKSNYVSVYDEAKQLWSILFDTEDQVAQLSAQLLVARFNLTHVVAATGALGPLDDGLRLQQDLRFNDAAGAQEAVEAGDGVEVGTVLAAWAGMRVNFAEPVENTQQRPQKLKLGKNKLPRAVEAALEGMRAGDRRLFVFKGAHFAGTHPQLAATAAFYDVTLLRIKKSGGVKETRSDSNAVAAQPPPPPVESERARSDSNVKDMSRVLNDQMNDPKQLDKAKLISRMAKMGQPMLPMAGGSNSPQPDEDAYFRQQQQQQQPLLAQQTHFQQQQQPMQMNAGAEYLMQQNGGVDPNVAAASLLLQQQQQQLQALQQQQQQQQLQQQLQQMALQNQMALQAGQLGAANNQLALLKPPQAALQQPQILMFPGQQPAPAAPVVQAPTEEAASTRILAKLGELSDKVEVVRVQTQPAASTASNLPSMETTVLLQNIQRICKENEQYKRELFEKSGKIEEQNARITELLDKAQTYVEQSHQLIEAKNSKFASNVEANIQRVFDLEKDRLRLTNELSDLTAKLSEAALEVNRCRASEQQMKERTLEMSRALDSAKQTEERLLVESAQTQTRLDKALNDLKNEKQARKQVEQRLTERDEELAELGQAQSALQRQLDDKKRRLEQDKVDAEALVDDMKRQHAAELKTLNDKLARLRSNASESLSEQMRQTEAELNREWQTRLDKQLEQLEAKYERQMEQLREERAATEAKAAELREQLKQAKLAASSKDADADRLNERVEELALFKEKYERLQQQALLMKEKFEARVRELVEEADAQADKTQELVAGEVKKLMSLIFKRLRQQINATSLYPGQGVLTAMLRLIKTFTVKVLEQREEKEPGEIGDEEDDEENYFAEFVYKEPPPPEPVIIHVPAPVSSPPPTPAVVEVKAEAPVEVKQEDEKEAEAVSAVMGDNSAASAYLKSISRFLAAAEEVGATEEKPGSSDDDEEIERLNEEEIANEKIKEIVQSMIQENSKAAADEEEEEQKEQQEADGDAAAGRREGKSSHVSSSSNSDDAIQLINEDDEIPELPEPAAAAKNDEQEEAEKTSEVAADLVSNAIASAADIHLSAAQVEEQDEKEQETPKRAEEEAKEAESSIYDEAPADTTASPAAKSDESSPLAKPEPPSPDQVDDADHNSDVEDLFAAPKSAVKDPAPAPTAEKKAKDDDDEDDDGFFADKQPATLKAKKSLFDDEDDENGDDDDDLFKPAQSAKLPSSNNNKPRSDSKPTTIDNPLESAMGGGASALKFSPPPLFGAKDESNGKGDDDDDWFK